MQTKVVIDLVILVNSGATMRGMEDATVRRFEAVLAERRALETDVLVTLVRFAERTELVMDRVPLAKVGPLCWSDCFTCGCGMVVDALGHAIAYVDETRCCAHFGGVVEQVEFVIISCNTEGASCALPYDYVLGLVDAKRAAGWKFSLLHPLLSA